MHRSSAARRSRVSIALPLIACALGFFAALPGSDEDVFAQTIARPSPVLHASTTPTRAAVRGARRTHTRQRIVAGALIPAGPVNQNDPYPSRLVIPSIGLSAPITGVGVNAAGEMAVPSGKTNNVGWYDGGPLPGGIGAAVLDAHVFAAFSKLKNLKPGDDIYVITAGNQKLHFIVAAAKVFALSAVRSDMLFTQTTDRALNLITCAGSLTPDHSTYDHRLIVYTTLAS